MSVTLPFSRVLRLGAAWAVVALAGALALVREDAREPEPALVVLVVALWGGLAGAGLRTGVFLVAARAGFVQLRRDAPPHLLWRLVPAPAVTTALLGAGLGLALTGAQLSPAATWSAGLVGVTLAAVLVARVVGRRDVGAPRSARRTTWVRWCVLGTALPAALLTAVVGALIAQVRFAGLGEVDPGELSRHLAVTLWSYGLFVGLAGALKTGRERRAGLVEVETPDFNAPPPLHVGGALGVAALWIGPMVLPAMPVDAVVVLKAAVGIGAGGLIGLLGALRGARTAMDD